MSFQKALLLGAILISCAGCTSTDSPSGSETSNNDKSQNTKPNNEPDHDPSKKISPKKTPPKKSSDDQKKDSKDKKKTGQDQQPVLNEKAAAINPGIAQVETRNGSTFYNSDGMIIHKLNSRAETSLSSYLFAYMNDDINDDIGDKALHIVNGTKEVEIKINPRSSFHIGGKFLSYIDKTSGNTVVHNEFGEKIWAVSIQAVLKFGEAFFTSSLNGLTHLVSADPNKGVLETIPTPENLGADKASLAFSGEVYAVAREKKEQEQDKTYDPRRFYGRQTLKVYKAGQIVFTKEVVMLLDLTPDFVAYFTETKDDLNFEVARTSDGKPIFSEARGEIRYFQIVGNFLLTGVKVDSDKTHSKVYLLDSLSLNSPHKPLFEATSEIMDRGLKKGLAYYYDNQGKFHAFNDKGIEFLTHSADAVDKYFGISDYFVEYKDAEGTHLVSTSGAIFFKTTDSSSRIWAH